LLVHNKGLVKTENFANAKYVGDPINAVKIFNEKEVDELIVLDIDASVEGRGPDFNLIRNLAVECRMPFCYGGGVTTVEDAKKIINLGAEKVAISSVIFHDFSLIERIGESVGVQSVVVVLDVKKKGLLGQYVIYIHNGKKATGIKLKDFLPKLEAVGVGEIVINNIDKDGKMNDYDYILADLTRKLTTVPISILGGAGSLDHIRELIKRYKVIGAAAGSLFVFKGKYKAVLISYPGKKEKMDMNKISMLPQ
jgi:cyclase